MRINRKGMLLGAVVIVAILGSILLWSGVDPQNDGLSSVVLDQDSSPERAGHRDPGDPVEHQRLSHRTLAPERPLVRVLWGDGTPVRGGEVQLLLGQGTQSILGAASISDAGAVLLDKAQAEAVRTKGATAIRLLFGGEDFGFLEPSISPSDSWPCRLVVGERAGVLTRFFDSRSDRDLHTVSIRQVGIPFRPQLPDRVDPAYRWETVGEQIDSPTMLALPSPGLYWAFVEGYAPKEFALPGMQEGLLEVPMDLQSVVYFHRKGVGSVDAGIGYQLSCSTWSHRENLDVPFGTTKVAMPPGSYQIRRASVEGDPGGKPACSFTLPTGGLLEVSLDSLVPGVQELVPVEGRLSGVEGLVDLHENVVIVIHSMDTGAPDRRVPAQPGGASGEWFWGPIEVLAGEYRASIARNPFGESFSASAGESVLLDWDVGGVSTVKFVVVDQATGEPVPIETLQCWQDASGAAPERRGQAPLNWNTVGFPTMRNVPLLAGVTWFQYGGGAYAQGLVVADLRPGFQEVYLDLKPTPKIVLELEFAPGGEAPSVKDLKSCGWRARAQTGAPRRPWQISSLLPIHSGKEAIILRAELRVPVSLPVEILAPQFPGYFQPPPLMVEDSEFVGRFRYTPRRLPLAPEDAGHLGSE